MNAGIAASAKAPFATEQCRTLYEDLTNSQTIF